ncbi:MAG TPA: CRISPR-associated protein Csx19 [Pyrinomonadaceae bacterium]|jgi:CRISPR-associated protein (TIGR03984 family)
MAQTESNIVNTKLFISRAAKNRKLIDAITACGATFHGAIALLYAPHKCFLAIVNNRGKFEDDNGEINASAVFEARVFNSNAELRWLNQEDGAGAALVLCEDQMQKFFDETKGDDKIYARIDPPQTYLLWGESVGTSDNKGWAKFAEARIGSFPVPIAGINADKKRRAQFTAVEYLGEYEDGNAAVCEERLTGIELVPIQETNHG